MYRVASDHNTYSIQTAHLSDILNREKNSQIN